MSKDAIEQLQPSLESAAVPQAAYTVWELVGYALKLGSLGFGGPVALVGYMHRDLGANGFPSRNTRQASSPRTTASAITAV